MPAVVTFVIVALIVIGTFHLLWWLFCLLMSILVLLYVGTIANQIFEGREATRATHAALSARADEQHKQFMRGDPAGYYGIYKPADIGRHFF